MSDLHEGAVDDEAERSDEPASAPGGPSRRSLIVGGLVAGLLIGAALGWFTSRGSDDDQEADDPVLDEEAPETAEAAAAFLVAWERGRTATFLSGSLLERTTSSGAVMELPIVVAQLPPDRVVSTGASVEGTVDGLAVVCDEQLDGLVHCQQQEAAGGAADGGAAFDAGVAAEMTALRGYVEGELPLYRVAQEGECFALRLARAVLAPPYGQNARFCFDATSGAPSLQHVERTDGTDTVTLVSVRADIDAADVARVAAGEIDQELLDG
ncbi:MAG: hypothetical protein JJE52_02040 [Acidimicrobiia bacterium]|nr:hypothetical protein [Acidimicrobiia bacterium]